MQQNEIKTSINGIDANKPSPLLDIDFSEYTDDLEAIKLINEGKCVLINNLYSEGLSLLNSISKDLKKKQTDTSFAGQRAFRNEYHTLSNRVLIRVKRNELVPRKSPSIGWFKILYPEVKKFYLTFPQVQGLNSSWQWYTKGVNIPTLRNKLTPFYGTYFPSRYSHLQLFENWLERYEGPKKSAIDVGVGSGVLSLQLIKHKFQKIFATDINVNAIIGLANYMGETKLSRKIELFHGSLFADIKKKDNELIVFNPPWIPCAQKMDNIDEAIYYTEDLFDNFFAEAGNYLSEDGKLVILFSNLALLTGQTKTNPIKEEIENNNRFKKDLLLTKKVKKASKNTTRDQSWRDEEYVELWVLTKK